MNKKSLEQILVVNRSIFKGEVLREAKKMNLFMWQQQFVGLQPFVHA